MRWYLFLLKESYRTPDIKAHTLEQAYNFAKKQYGDKVLPVYQTCSLNGTTFSGWKNMTKDIS